MLLLLLNQDTLPPGIQISVVASRNRQTIGGCNQMYPRNNISPPTIDLGEIVLKSDGTQQTTGVSARVKIGTGSWDVAAGTLVCDATSGIWTYTPTQAETNADFFLVAAYKSNCTSISKTIITTGSATSGRALLSSETHTGAIIPTVTTITNRVSANTDQWNGVGVTGMPMPTYIQPTGFLAATFPAIIASPTNITAGTITTVTNLTNLPAIPNNWITSSGIANDAITDAKVAADVTIASVTGSVGSISGITFPSNFSSLAITVGGAVTAGTIADKTGYSLASGGLDLVTTWTVGITGNITGSVGSVTNAVTVGTINSNVITATSIASGAFTSAKFAAGAFDAVWTVTTRSLTTFGTLVSDIWGHATRILTAGTNIVLAKGTGVTGFNDLDATGVRNAVGLASANLDTQLADIPTVSEFNARSLPSASIATESTVITVGLAVTDRPTLAAIEASSVLAKEATVATRATQVSVDGLPTKIDVQNAGLF